MFVNKPTIAFARNKNIQELILGHLINDGKVAQEKSGKQQIKSKAFNTARSTLCCMHVVNTNAFKSKQTKGFNICQTITCKPEWII